MNIQKFIVNDNQSHTFFFNDIFYFGLGFSSFIGTTPMTQDKHCLSLLNVNGTKQIVDCYKMCAFYYHVQ